MTVSSGGMTISSRGEDNGSEMELSIASTSENQPVFSTFVSHQSNKTEASSFISSDIPSSPELVSLATGIK